MKSFNSELYNEIIVRVIIICSYLIIGLFDPLVRKIQPEEIWMYQYPTTKSICSIYCLWAIIISLSTVIILTNYVTKNDKEDLEAAVLCVTLSIATTVTITRLLKFATGKPRPDFYWRCFPEGFGNDNMECYGNTMRIKEGRQSFPSGHASLAFSGLGFISLYLAGKLKVYELKGKGHSWRFLICLLPIITACLVGISRICDYHHHPVDVLAGTILGSIVTILCYHHYYPPFYKPNCDVPYSVQHQE